MTSASGQTRTILLGAAGLLSPTADPPSRTSGAAMAKSGHMIGYPIVKLTITPSD
jgi:hypothetical protein